MALLIAGTNSGCGKSTVTLGVLSAMTRLGKQVQAFKAGPDFIDPGIHGLITGRPSRNLDLWMCGPDYVKRCLREHSAGAEAVVIEGVMGLYDGGERSTAALANEIGAKVVLVVNAYGMAESAGALLKGFGGYGTKVDGVIFNQVGSERHYERLKAAAGAVEPLGYIPRETAFKVAERHLGLVVAEEFPIDEESIGRLADAVHSCVDMDRVLEMARPPVSNKNEAGLPEPHTRVAIAMDKAFCFYYEDNLDMLREAGAEIVPFSPLDDGGLPEAIDALYIGGGYPEMHARELSENETMTSSIREWAESGGPVYAECGGLMYLGEGIVVGDEHYPMVGVFPFRSAMREKRTALGYREICAGQDCLLGKRGQTLRGHEFHYSEVVDAPDKEGMMLNVLSEKGQRVSSVLYKSVLASYTHVHFGSRPGSARHFIDYLRGSSWKK